MQAPDLPPDAAWAAVLRRDEDAAGRFVYAVRTTGVYCRPGCASRTPRRENVAFFSSPARAEAAGFRACRRCRPDAAEPSAVARARAYLDGRFAEDPEARVTLAELSEAVGLSRAHLQRTFTREAGLSPAAYLAARRMERARAALAAGEPVLTAALDAGLGSAKPLYGGALGMTPGRYRRGGAGERVRYAVFDTALGAALIAATDRGVCAVALGDAPEPLERDLRARFHAADLARDDDALGPWAEPVLRYLAGAPGQPAEALQQLPLDLRGTAFQRRVWAALREIPPGQTRSYAEVAAAIGRPTAARAVAQACGANRVALAVPCHRVVGADGALRGYRWGPARKRALLELEAGECEDG